MVNRGDTSTDAVNAGDVNGTAAVLVMYKHMQQLGVPMYVRPVFEDAVLGQMGHRCPGVVADVRAAAKTPSSPASGPVNCHDPDLSQAEWMKHCSK